eukprot:PhM_4_TR2119/c2_g1_i7/m.57434
MNNRRHFLRRFMKRHNLGKKKAEKHNLPEMWHVHLHQYVATLRFHLAHVPPASIWNMDETGLMYHNVVQHTVTSRKNVRVEGYNCGNTKARCSVVLKNNYLKSILP